jgi:Bacterial regulatory helix-turn-helix protein, lysR family
MANMRWADRIGRRLKLRDLHVLFAVAQWGSMAKAAQHLAVSQPVVSAAIADLERAVGVRLLDRSRRGVEPTIYGTRSSSMGPLHSMRSSGASRKSSFWQIPPWVNCASVAQNGLRRDCFRSSLIGYHKSTRELSFMSIRRLLAREVSVNCASEA